jgi:hypothetical protein
MAHQLGKDGLAGIHPSLSKTGAGTEHRAESVSGTISNRKNSDQTHRHDFQQFMPGKENLTGQQCFEVMSEWATGYTTAITI